MSDVPAEGPTSAGLADHPVAAVGLAAVAHSGPYNAPVTSLSRSKLADIFTGRITDWSEVGGTPQRIIVVHRIRGSGTRAAFSRLLLGTGDFPDGARDFESSGQVQATLLSTAGSISYLAFSYAHPQLKRLAVEGAAPTSTEVAEGRYPLWAMEHLYTRGQLSRCTLRFVDFCRGQRVQSELVPQFGFLSLAGLPMNGQAR